MFKASYRALDFLKTISSGHILPPISAKLVETSTGTGSMGEISVEDSDEDHGKPAVKRTKEAAREEVHQGSKQERD